MGAQLAIALILNGLDRLERQRHRFVIDAALDEREQARRMVYTLLNYALTEGQHLDV